MEPKMVHVRSFIFTYGRVNGKYYNNTIFQSLFRTRIYSDKYSRQLKQKWSSGQKVFDQFCHYLLPNSYFLQINYDITHQQRESEWFSQENRSHYFNFIQLRNIYDQRKSFHEKNNKKWKTHVNIVKNWITYYANINCFCVIKVKQLRLPRLILSANFIT